MCLLIMFSWWTRLLFGEQWQGVEQHMLNNLGLGLTPNTYEILKIILFIAAGSTWLFVRKDRPARKYILPKL